MKTALSILSILMLVGCGTAPVRPNFFQISEEIAAGRMKAADVERVFEDYKRDREAYENSTGYKLGVGALLVGVSALSLVAGSLPRSYGSGYLGGYSSPSKIVVGTTPTAGGGAVTTIKAYK